MPLRITAVFDDESEDFEQQVFETLSSMGAEDFEAELVKAPEKVDRPRKKKKDLS